MVTRSFMCFAPHDILAVKKLIMMLIMVLKSEGRKMLKFDYSCAVGTPGAQFALSLSRERANYDDNDL